jgi:hypothetical protein
LEDGKYEIAEFISEQINEAMGGWSIIGKLVNIDGDIHRIISRFIDANSSTFTLITFCSCIMFDTPITYICYSLNIKTYTCKNKKV